MVASENERLVAPQASEAAGLLNAGTEGQEIVELAPAPEITGAMLSVTVTLKVQDALPQEFVAVTVMVVTPVLKTEPLPLPEPLPLVAPVNV